MTAQAHDLVRYDGEDWSLTGSSRSLFSVADHGIVPGMLTTACWRGHYCVYAVRDGRLVLDELRLGHGTRLHDRPVEGGEPLLGGVVVAVPRERASWLGEPFALHDLAWPLPFTGTLVLARDVVSRGPHMGYWPTWRFGRILDLAVSDGAVTGVTDRSADMAEILRGVESGERDEHGFLPPRRPPA